jgi:hypothetical protein
MLKIPEHCQPGLLYVPLSSYSYRKLKGEKNTDDIDKYTLPHNLPEKHKRKRDHDIGESIHFTGISHISYQ